jgi:HPr kinase/phosphorylase
VEEQKLNIVYPSTDYEKVLIKTGDVHRPGLQLAGFYDYFDPTRVQLIGNMETAFLKKFTPQERQEKVDFYMSKKFPALIVATTRSPARVYRGRRKIRCDDAFHQQKHSQVMADIIRVIKIELAPRVTRHGVLVEVYGLGLLLLGESGVGKSEAAIELLKRGHRLIADDAVEIRPWPTRWKAPRPSSSAIM